MYLISIYFDEGTEKKLMSYMNQVAKHTRNDTMIAGNIPPHITISSFYAKDNETAVRVFRRIAARASGGGVHWVSVGCFFPQVLFLSPIYNEYLHQLAVIAYDEICRTEGVSSSRYYQPFEWMPHTTLGKRFTPEQLVKAFQVMQNQFAPFVGRTVKIGLAKTNPYEDVEIFVLK